MVTIITYWSRKCKEEFFLALEHFLNLSDEKQNKIIYASMEEFARYGYNSASTNNIAKNAGVSKGVLFKYFSNKENLFLFVCKKIENSINSWIKERSKFNHKSLYDTLKSLIVNEIEFFYNEPLIYMLYQEIMRHPEHPIYKKVLNDLDSSFESYILEVVNHIPKNELRDNISVEDVYKIVQWIFDGFKKQVRISMKNTGELTQDVIIYELEKIFDVLKFGIFK